MLAINQLAPDFTLPDQNGDLLHLADLHGQRVLIYFYPKAMTPGCTAQACGLRDIFAELAALKVRVLGISADAPERLKRFETRDRLNFTLLSDSDHQVARAYESYGMKKFMGVSYEGILRYSYLLDEEGRIIKSWNKFKTSEHHQVVLDYLNPI